MAKIKFEYKITILYLAIGSLWILFSDRFLNLTVKEVDVLTELQTYKGWFYVIVTGLLFFLFINSYLSKLRSTETELEKHKNNLQQLVEEKTRHLDSTLEELHEKNEELNDKNNIISDQNTELKSTLHHLKETQSQLLQAEKMASLGILTAGVAHEINNPLNYILGGYTGLEHFFKESNIDNKKVNLLMNHIKTGIDRAAAIVSGLNQFSRNDESYSEHCDIHKIIDNCLLMLSNQFKNRIEVKKNYTHNAFFLTGNVSQLHQVFINIFLNAGQAIENDGLITVTTFKSENWLCINVSDTGVGISEENIHRVTDPFFTTKAPGKGAGLGLSITFSIIQAHRGQLDFESEPNKGTTVKIKLPLKEMTNE